MAIMASLILVMTSWMSHSWTRKKTINLEELAEARSCMIESDFEHDGEFNSTYITGWGENLYQGSSGRLEYILKLWKESPKHNEILNEDYKEMVLIVRKTDDSIMPYKAVYLIQR